MDGEILGEEYCEVKNKWKNGVRLMIWAAISADGPERIRIVEHTMDGDAYDMLLGEELPYIQGIVSREKTFM